MKNNSQKKQKTSVIVFITLLAMLLAYVSCQPQIQNSQHPQFNNTSNNLTDYKGGSFAIPKSPVYYKNKEHVVNKEFGKQMEILTLEQKMRDSYQIKCAMPKFCLFNSTITEFQARLTGLFQCDRWCMRQEGCYPLGSNLNHYTCQAMCYRDH